jgi:hypothetical protein
MAPQEVNRGRNERDDQHNVNQTAQHLKTNAPITHKTTNTTARIKNIRRFLPVWRLVPRLSPQIR